MGVAYLPPVRKAFEQLADSTLGLFGGSERGQISIHAPVSLASLWLAPQLPAFSRAFPGIDVRLSSVIWDHTGTRPKARISRFGTARDSGAATLPNSSATSGSSPFAASSCSSKHGRAATRPRGC